MGRWRVWMAGLLLACSLGVVACSGGKDAIASDRVTFEGTPPPWADVATDVMVALEDWRGLKFKEPLKVTFQPQADPKLNGWYNSQTKELVVNLNGSEKMGRGVLLHEIFHALQDQHFDLYQLRLKTLDLPDANTALSAIIEGEAMLATSEQLNYNFLDHARLPKDGPVSEDFFENIFLYGAGLKFIQAVRAEGGWDAVSQVFQDPPQATALILRPERYLAGERQAKTVAIPLEPGELLQQQMIRGEYQVQLLLARQAETRSQLQRLGDSYIADTLGIVQDATGQVRHRWMIQLDSAEAAEELVESFEGAIAIEKPTAQVTPTGKNLRLEW